MQSNFTTTKKRQILQGIVLITIVLVIAAVFFLMLFWERYQTPEVIVVHATMPTQTASTTERSYSISTPTIQIDEANETIPSTTEAFLDNDMPDQVPPEPKEITVTTNSPVSTPVPIVPQTEPSVAPSAQSAASYFAPSVKVVTAPRQISQGVGFSVADTLPGQSGEELNRRIDDMASLGVTWVRMDFNWRWLQPDPNKEIDWTKIDRVITALHARNINVLPILVYTPRWARPEWCTDSERCQPEDVDDYAAFAKAAVTRYKSWGVHQWEIWNEPNMRGSWLYEANAEEYTALLKAAYTSIKEVDPTAVVVTAGLGPAATRNGNVAPLEYLEQMYKAGAHGYFDAVGFHPYSYPVVASYDQPWNAWQQMNDTAVSLKSIMKKYGDGSKKIWITEYGAPTNGPGSAAENTDDWRYHDPTHVTEDYQAVMIEDAIANYENASWVGPLFLYSYKDIGTSRDTIENFFGVIRNDGSPKPAYYTIQELLTE